MRLFRPASDTEFQPVAQDQPPHLGAWPVFALACAVNLMSGIQASIIAVGLPTMERSLNTSLSWIGWALVGYALASTITLPIAGKLSDELGRKRILVGAILLFTVAGFACGFATNVYALIFFRALQGFAAGVFPPSSTGLVSDFFGNRRRSAIGFMTSLIPIGGIIGPSLGGIIIDGLSWQWIFYLNGPIGLLMLWAALRYLPKMTPRHSRQPVDRTGIALYATGIFAILFAMTRLGNTANVADPLIWSLVGIGLLLVVLWVRHEAHVEFPLVELQLLKWRPMLGANLYAIAMGAVVFGFNAFIPYYAQVGFGMTASRSGFLTSPQSVASAALSAFCALFLLKRGYRLPMALGMGMVALSLFLISFGISGISIFGYHPSNAVILGALVALVGGGVGLAQPAANNACLDLLPDKVASITGLRGMFRSTAGVLGTAFFVLALSYADDKKAGMEQIFLVMSIVFALSISCVFLIPDGRPTAADLARGKQITAAKRTDAPAIS